MTSLTSKSRKHYRRFYRLVAGAVILMTAVLTGSLLLGDSVRGTLVQRVGERLGKTETIITSGMGFMSDMLTQDSLLKEAQGYLLMDGFVSVGEKLLPVYVWGTDADSLAPDEALVNEPLNAHASFVTRHSAAESPSTRTRQSSISTLILHLPSHNMVPSGSLFVTKSYATQMRFQVVGVKGVEEGGNLLLRNEQTLPLNVFVNRQHLAEKMGLEGKINLILSKDIITEEHLAACWTPEMSGIHLTDSSLTSHAVFISRDIVEKQPTSIRYFSYFVNEITRAHSTLPLQGEMEKGSSLYYSFVTAVNEWQGEPLVGQDMILSDYAAKRLHVSEGDSVAMSYFVARDLKNLETQGQRFRVKRIVPLADFMCDSLLMADFPGLSHVEKCTDWDSDLPIKMERVTKEDEDFWYTYHQTPKAIVSYEAVSPDWSNAFGCATALRFAPPSSPLSPGDAGVQMYYPREQALKGAIGGVDFASLFLSLGFFIILAAVLLMKNPLVEMFTLRRNEIQLYRQLGFKDKAIGKRLFWEAFSVMILASPVGIIAALIYSSLTLWLLGNVWSGATHTEGFALHIQPLTILIGWAVGLLICAIVLWRVLRTMLKASIRHSSLVIHQPTLSLTSASSSSREGWEGFSSHSSLFAYLLLFLTAALVVVNFIYFHSMVLFIVCGLLWILTGGLFLRLYVKRQSSFVIRHSTLAIRRTQLMWQSVRASLKQHLLAYWSLSLGVFTVFAVGLNRPDFRQSVQATGGYHYYVDCRVPIQYDLNNSAVRQKLSLQSLPDSTQFLGFLRHTQDEASCLNLNQVSTPTVLGIDLKDMAPFGLTPPSSSYISTPSQPRHPSCSLFIDEESLLWSLKKSVGDTLFYQDYRGEQVPVVIAGTYPTGIFHGNAIMSVDDFRRLWPKDVGVEVLLMKSSRPEEAAELLSTAMNEYGLRVQTVEDRIKMFFEVTETYLLIFLTLGGLGLLLGIFSLMIIVRKNLTAQAATIRQYRAMGFSERLISQLLLRENLLAPLYAICVGATGAVISISANISGAGKGTLLLALACLVVICLLLYYGIKFMINQSVNNQTQI